MEVTRSRLAFLTIVVAEFAHALTAAAQHRVPIGHDGFQFFTLQYYFLNNAIHAHEAAQWVPYMNQGTSASIWHGIQATLLQSVLMHLPWLPRTTDLLTVHHMGMFVDEMVLVTGTWLLARRFFSLPTVFFITVSVAGSSVWLDQPYWNFRLYYAMPLVLELGHRFLDTGKWRWFFLAMNLMAVQMLGNLPYLIPVFSFAICTYFVAYAGVHPHVVVKQLRALQWHAAAVAAIAGGALSLAAAYRSFTIGTESLVSYNPYRNPDGTNSLETFLTYGGATDVTKWIDMALNLSPWMDMTLYAGMLMLPLLVLAVPGIRRRQLHFAIAAIIVLLFTLATPLATALFHVWPGMKYFRHIGLVSPLVRVLFCFTAGIGFEWLIHQRGPRLAVAGVVLSALLIAIGLFAFDLSFDHAGTRHLVDAISNPGVSRPDHVQLADRLARRLWQTTLIAGFSAIIVGFGALALSSPWFSKRSAAHPIWITLVLMFLGAEIYHFKFAYLFQRSDVVPESVRFVERPAAMDFPVRREVNLKAMAVAGHNRRLSATVTFSTMFQLRVQGRASKGAQYWTNNMFVFADEAGSTFQVDSWLKPFDQLIRTYWHRPIDDTSGFPPHVDLRELAFPLEHPAAGRITGVTADKIRFFSRAHAVESVDALPPLLTDDTYAGDMLFVVKNDTNTQTIRHLHAWNPEHPLSTDDSQALNYQVERFDANTLRVAVNNPGASSWMAYSDVWHPLWRATVNGTAVPIYRANVAFKAVPIEAGANVIEFRFGSRLFSLLAAWHAMNAAFWIAATVWLMGSAGVAARSGKDSLT